MIEVGEDLDSHTMLHELSHAWFNHSAIAERWLSEGLADEIGARAVAALGDPLPRPDDYDIVGQIDRSDFDLNSWSQPSETKPTIRPRCTATSTRSACCGRSPTRSARSG